MLNGTLEAVPLDVKLDEIVEVVVPSPVQEAARARDLVRAREDVRGT